MACSVVSNNEYITTKKTNKELVKEHKKLSNELKQLKNENKELLRMSKIEWRVYYSIKEQCESIEDIDGYIKYLKKEIEDMKNKIKDLKGDPDDNGTKIHNLLEIFKKFENKIENDEFIKLLNIIVSMPKFLERQ